jgi:aminoglycoside phosphotransferase (APT) family kinase protein
LTAAAPKAPTEDGALRAWLAARLGLASLEIADQRAPAAGGWSSETWMLTARDGARAAADRRIVLRLAPSGPAMFPEYDLGRQVACMRALKGVEGR